MDMAKKADVVVQNFRPGVLARLGYGYEDFKAVNPRIIYCSGSGYGEEGPYVDRPGQDMLIQGLAGFVANTGRGDMAPVPAGAGLADQIGAMNMVYGILSALYYREKTGKGQKIEVNLLAGMLAHLAQEFVGVLNLGEDFVRPNSGIGHPGMQAPFGIYETRDGHYVSIAMSPYKTLYETLEAPHLAVYDDLEDPLRQARRGLGEGQRRDKEIRPRRPATTPPRRRHLVRAGQRHPRGVRRPAGQVRQDDHLLRTPDGRDGPRHRPGREDERDAGDDRIKGRRALGTRVSAAVRSAVMDEGSTWLDSAFVVNDWYISAYEPLVDSYGKRVGMLYVGFLQKPFERREV